MKTLLAFATFASSLPSFGLQLYRLGAQRRRSCVL
jgi:hypothetical protein